MVDVELNYKLHVNQKRKKNLDIKIVRRPKMSNPIYFMVYDS